MMELIKRPDGLAVVVGINQHRPRSRAGLDPGGIGAVFDLEDVVSKLWTDTDLRDRVQD